MNNEQPYKGGFTQEEINEAHAVADNIVDLWNSSKSRRYKFGAEFHEFGEANYILKLGFTSVAGWIDHRGISVHAANRVRRIYRKLTLERGVPMSDYAQIDLAKTTKLMSLIDAKPDRELYLEALELGIKLTLPDWQVWIEKAIARINSGDIS